MMLNRAAGYAGASAASGGGHALRIATAVSRDGFSAERPSAARHLVKHHAEREDVAPGVHHPSLDLLRRHVGHGPDDHPVLRLEQRRQVGVLPRSNRFQLRRTSQGRSRAP